MTARATQKQDLEWVREALRSRCGLRSEEVADPQLERALRAAAGTAGVGHDELVERIRAPQTDGGLALQHLLRKVTVGETTFFRHSDDLDWLRTRVLPALIARREQDGSRCLRIWSAGCATGEEAYTLAMLALEAVPSPSWRIQVMGSDINDEALAAARAASYGEWSFRGVSPELKARWFEKVPGEREAWTPLAAVRGIVDFQYLNLRDPIFPSIFTRTTELDLVLCRNVFLYFFPEAVRSCLERFTACLVGDGALLCGPADLFQTGASAPLREDGASHRLRIGAVPPVAKPKRAATPPPAARKAAAPVAPAPAAAPAGDELVRMLSAGDYVTAAEKARLLLVANPLALETARCRALALSALPDSAAASDAWAKVLYLDAADPGAHFALGMVLLHAKRRPEARAHFRAVVRLLRDVADGGVLPGPDALPVTWVRAACKSLSGEGAA
jgi:chemotaxis protein methyltransferase CheR